MTNIWGFLLQTIFVTIIAVTVLIVKTVLADKLSPRWQYGVWIVLIMCIFLPVSINRKLFFDLCLWMEILKADVEAGLESVYTQVYVAIQSKHVIPVIHVAPKSITDWLFAIYSAGIIICLFKYLFAYIRIRVLLHKGRPASKELEHQICEVCEIYDLKPCQVVEISGLPSAFVCGTFSPVLAVPADMQMDDKIFIHELIHLKYKDSMQSIGWCILRSLHWCNPMMQMVFNRIGNDMEALCDQRVLEQLEGEERREYGKILLDMANDKYARVPGTSSISNGGKNISRRIKAIVHFKKYPKGMGLVSWCIVIILLCCGFGASYITTWGSSKNEKAQASLIWTQDMFTPYDDREWNRSMAMARINRCTTVAGALDTYAKGLMLENGIYIATASPLDTHEELAKRMKSGLEETNVARFPWNLDSGFNMEYIEQERGYSVLNLTEKEDGSYDALLAFSVLIFYVNEQKQNFIQYEDGSCYTDNTMIIPVNIRYEDAWVVEEVGERIQVLFSREELQFKYHAFPHVMDKVVENEIGITTISAITIHEVKNPKENFDDSGAMPFFGYSTFDSTANLSAEFENVWGYYMADYSCKDVLPQPETSIAVRMAVLDEKNKEFEFPDKRMNEGTDEWEGKFVYGYSPIDGDYDGVIDENWNGTVAAQKIEKKEVGEEFTLSSAVFGIQLFRDGVVEEKFIVDGGM